MKRAIIILLAVLLIVSMVAHASEVPQISGNLFTCAKQALYCLGSGEYERLVTVVPFSGVSPSASEWQNFAEGNFSTLSGNVQTEYAVAYWSGNVWKLAVPVSEPSVDTVEALVLTSSDGAVFSGYGYATWAEVKSEYLFAAYVTWDVEYLGSNLMVAAD